MTDPTIKKCVKQPQEAILPNNYKMSVFE